MENVPVKANSVPERPTAGFLTRAEIHRLTDVPPEAEWFGNIENKNTRRAYRNDLRDFMCFAAVERPEDFRIVTRAHVIPGEKDLEARSLSAATIQRKLSALSDLFDYLCERSAITHNPVKVVNEGKTPAITDAQARALVDAPTAYTLKGKRDRAILAVLTARLRRNRQQA